MKIGVFDSGVGGLSVSNAIEEAFPEHQVLYRNDAKNVPYGKRSPQEILELCSPIIAGLIDEGCEVIVLACNTVSTTIIESLRAKFDVPLIGVEPLVKLASEMTKTGTVAICATPTTLSSQRYRKLLSLYGSSVTVVEPDCSEWSYLIEQQAIEEHYIAKTLEPALRQNADVIVLGCTHYHWIEKEIQRIAEGRATVIQPEPFVIEELNQVIQRLK